MFAANPYHAKPDWFVENFSELIKKQLKPAQITELIKKLLCEYNLSSGKPYRVTASFGASCGKPANVEEVDVMINEADERMYEYKKAFKKSQENSDVM